MKTQLNNLFFDNELLNEKNNKLENELELKNLETEAFKRINILYSEAINDFENRDLINEKEKNLNEEDFILDEFSLEQELHRAKFDYNWRNIFNKNFFFIFIPIIVFFFFLSFYSFFITQKKKKND